MKIIKIIITVITIKMTKLSNEGEYINLPFVAAYV